MTNGERDRKEKERERGTLRNDHVENENNVSIDYSTLKCDGSKENTGSDRRAVAHVEADDVAERNGIGGCECTDVGIGKGTGCYSIRFDGIHCGWRETNNRATE